MPSGESSLLLWLMAIVVTLLGAHVFIAWIRRAQGPGSWRAATLAGAALGLGLTCSMLLTMSAEALPFPLGYRWLLVPALWLLPWALCVPLAWWLMRRRDWLVLIVCSVLLAAIAIAVQAGWIFAAGLRPGLRWNFVWVGAAVAVQLLGFLAGLWMAFSDASSEGDRKTLWRAGAALLLHQRGAQQPERGDQITRAAAFDVGAREHAGGRDFAAQGAWQQAAGDDDGCLFLCKYRRRGQAGHSQNDGEKFHEGSAKRSMARARFPAGLSDSGPAFVADSGATLLAGIRAGAATRAGLPRAIQHAPVAVLHEQGTGETSTSARALTVAGAARVGSAA